jgi:hypothetical protein
MGAKLLSTLPAAQQAALTGRSFFPSLISAPFRAGLHEALNFAIVVSVLAAAASWTRGKHVAATDIAAVPAGEPVADAPVADAPEPEATPAAD